MVLFNALFFFFSSRRRHTRYWRDWSSDVCSSDLHRLKVTAKHERGSRSEPRGFRGHKARPVARARRAGGARWTAGRVVGARRGAQARHAVPRERRRPRPRPPPLRRDPTVARLEALVSRARPLVYDRARRVGSVAEFATTGYWRRVRERPGLLLVSTLLLF